MSTCSECGTKAGFHTPACSRAITEHSARRAPAPRIFVGAVVVHVPTNKTRRVSGVRGTCVHFAQCIKFGARTFYWADASVCLRVSP